MATTKIALEYPYSADWRKGYVVINPEGRRTLILYNSQTDRSSCQYARYLLSVKHGRYLTGEEQTDHVDGDKSNDNIDNLQILSQKENLRKSSKGITVTEHGTLSMYRYCKCDLCREAKSVYSKKARLLKLQSNN